jgi:hypothetical protein
MSTGDPENFVEGTPIQAERLGAVDTYQSTTPVIPTNPAEMLYLAMSQGRGMEELQKFMDLKDRWEASEARKAFVAALSRFKGNDIVVTKDRKNNQYDSRYTSLGNLVDTVTPFLSKEELSVDWKIDQTKPGIIRVGCTITHSHGHSETTWFECPPDKSGNKNGIQEIKSAITYAKSVTFESICGLASTEANMDDDGNGAHRKTPIKDATGAEVLAVDIEKALADIAATTNVPDLVKAFNLHYGLAQKGKDRPVMEQLMAAQNKRKAEITKGGVK